jgi:hypothetical protein
MKINREEKVLLYIIDSFQSMINKGFFPQEIFTEKGEALKYVITSEGKKILKKLKPEPTPDEIVSTIIDMGNEGLINKKIAFDVTEGLADKFFLKN